MQPIGPSGDVGLIGIVVQLAACVLVTVLILGLRRQHRDRDYFALWSWGWIAISIAILAIAIRYHVVPMVAAEPVSLSSGPLVGPLHALYLAAKLAFFGFLLLGVLALTGDRRAVPRDRLALLIVSGVLGVAAVAATRDLNELVMAQAAIVVPVLGVAIWRLSRLPEEGPNPGLRILLIGLLLLTAQWALYILSFARAGLPPASLWHRVLAFMTGFNSFLDAGELIVVGIGMALVLVEHNHREATATQAARVSVETAARARLAEILAAAHEGILTLDATRVVDLANPAAAVLFGHTTESIRGLPFDRFLGPEHRDPLWNALAAVTRRSEANPPVAVRREVIGLRDSGDAFPMELAVSSFGDGTDRGWVLVVRDLTEVIRAREDQERVQTQLAHTARLEAVGRMVSGVAHELNNPLTAIMAFAQDLAATSRSEEDREALTVIVQQAERCRVVVGDLLIFARSRREERRRVAPGDLVARVTRVFGRESSRSQVAFDVAVAPELPPIEVDATGMEQVLTNLLTNAFQASPPGGRVTLTVSAADGRVSFSVSDTGPGISAQAMPRLFEPFFTTKAPGEGTGLGLSVSHAIVSQHGGTIDVENLGAGSGARFRINLPFVDRRQGEVSGPDDGADEPPPGRVLIVDDEPAIRVAVRRSLERRGWQVDEAADGAEAWLKIEVGGRPTDYDVVVTDLRMPGMSGIELVDRIRERHPSLADRTIVITGDTASPSVAEFLARLPTPHLQKPFDIRQLIEVVDRVRSGAKR